MAAPGSDSSVSIPSPRHLLQQHWGAGITGRSSPSPAFLLADAWDSSPSFSRRRTDQVGWDTPTRRARMRPRAAPQPVEEGAAAAAQVAAYGAARSDPPDTPPLFFSESVAGEDASRLASESSEVVVEGHMVRSSSPLVVSPRAWRSVRQSSGSRAQEHRWDQAEPASVEDRAAMEGADAAPSALLAALEAPAPRPLAPLSNIPQPLPEPHIAPEIPSRGTRTRLTRAEREAKRVRSGSRLTQAEKARAAQERERWRAANRLRHRRADTMQDITVRIDAAALAEGGVLDGMYDAVRVRMAEDGAAVHVDDASLAHSLAGTQRLVTASFVRRVTAEYDAARKLFEPLAAPRQVAESTLLLLLRADELLAALEDGSLHARIAAATLPDAAPLCAEPPREPVRRFLLVLGLDALLRQRRNAANRAYTQRVRERVQGGAPSGALQLPSADAHDMVEAALVDLQMRHRHHVVRVANQGDLVEWLHALTCDVSMRPYRCVYAACTDAPGSCRRSVRRRGAARAPGAARHRRTACSWRKLCVGMAMANTATVHAARSGRSSRHVPDAAAAARCMERVCGGCWAPSAAGRTLRGASTYADGEWPHTAAPWAAAVEACVARCG